jgi:hypothetical protein
MAPVPPIDVAPAPQHWFYFYLVFQVPIMTAATLHLAAISET